MSNHQTTLERVVEHRRFLALEKDTERDDGRRWRVVLADNFGGMALAHGKTLEAALESALGYCEEKP